MPFCTECGSKTLETDKFCNNCGAPQRTVTQQQTSHTPPPPPPAQPRTISTSGEIILGALCYFQRTKSFGRRDPYLILATQQNLILVHITNEIVKRNAEENKQDAEDEGKGFFGQWGAQLAGSFNFGGKYRGVSKEQVLAELPEAMTIPVQSVSKVEIKLDQNTDDYGVIHRKYKLRINAPGEKYNFESNMLEKDIDVLKTLFQGRLKTNLRL